MVSSRPGDWIKKRIPLPAATRVPSPRRRRQAPRRASGERVDRSAIAYPRRFAAISRKPTRPPRKAATATSLAALRIAGRAPPASTAARARRSAGKRTGSGASKSSRPTLTRSSGSPASASGSGQASAQAIGVRMSGVPSWAMVDPSTYSHHRVDHRLAVDDDLDLVGLDREQVERLDQFEPLVHHRGAVDADLGAHRPIGVRDRLRGSDGPHVGERAVAERAARCGQQDASDAVRVARLQALEDRRMLAVDGEQRRGVAGDRILHHVAGRDQSLLVGEREDAALLDRGDRGFQAGGADDRGDGDVSAHSRRLAHRVRAARRFDPGSDQRVAERGQAGFVGDHSARRARPDRGGGELGDVAIGGERDDAERLGRALDQVEGRGADRAGRAQIVTVFMVTVFIARPTHRMRAERRATPPRVRREPARRAGP